MKTLLRKIFRVVAPCWFIALFVCGFLAYFVSSAKGGAPVDGLGRQIYEAPVLMRVLFGQERMWAGWLWFFIDMVAFWGSIAAAFKISELLEEKE